MVDEVVDQQMSQQDQEAHDAAIPGRTEPEVGVTIKEDAIDRTKQDESAEDRKKRLNISDIPGHNYETEQIQKDRAKEIADADPKPYEYRKNGYVVKEIEGANQLASDPKDANTLYEVTAGEDFKQVFNTKRAAEIYAETHAPHRKD